ncbi:50S ribosomal protein L10 [Candidatus Kaiserbacteria bacterium]|nr:50S ribosomal protein L10 [Candidatus Kaiserbacteria bacterium]
MSITKEKKRSILAKLKDIADDSETLVFAGFSGLPVAETTAMRKALRDKQIGYLVAKKTLIYRALDARGFSGTRPAFEKEVAVVYGKDPIAPAQGVREFENLYKQRLSILGGVFAGAYKTKEEMTEIASIPALPVLRGMFVNVINSPIQGLVLALNAIATKRA